MSADHARSLAVIGVDIGGSKVEAELIGPNGDTVRHTRIEQTVDSERDVVRSVLNAVRRVRGTDPITAVGIAIAGWLSPDRTTVRIAANLGLRNVALTAQLSAVLGVATFMHNDGDAAAYAEHAAAATVPRCLLALTLGTGLGAGLVVDGTLLTGSAGLAGELGHQQVRSSGATCICGGTGCAELYASGGGVATLARARLPGVEVRTAQDVLSAARSGDVNAATLLEEAGQTIGQLIAAAVPLVNPDLVVIGGGFGTAAADFLLPAAVAETARRRSMTSISTPVSIVASMLGSRAAAAGAAALARRYIKSSCEPVDA